MLFNGSLEPIFIEISFDEKKKNYCWSIIYRHPHMPINDFCDNFVIECLNKIALLDNTCILMGDFNINLLKSNPNNVAPNFLEVMTSCFFVPYIQEPTRVVRSFATLIDNILMNSVEFVTVSGNLLCQLADHLFQFLVLKDFRVSYRPKHEQIFKRNYRFFNNNEFKNEINQIEWKTLFDSHDMNLCFEKFLHILTCVFDDHAPIKKLLKRRNPLMINHGFIITYEI